MRQYFAVHVRRGYETKVKAILLKKHSAVLQNGGVRIFIAGNKGDHLPGYLIIGCRNWSDELYYLLKHTVGVIRVIRNSIPKREVSILFKKLSISMVQEYLQTAKELAKQKGYLKMIINNLYKFRKVMAVKPKRNLVWSDKPLFPLLD
ncbi:MAG: hypothetical protein RBT41_05535 [Clostridia bacterium]|nr:hypothetical protein [Clostridia bacterium]